MAESISEGDAGSGEKKGKIILLKQLAIVTGIGIGAFLAIFLGISGVMIIDHQIDDPSTFVNVQIGESEIEQQNPPNYIQYGWGHLASHFIPINVIEPSGDRAGDFNSLTDTMNTIPIPIIYLIPPLVLSIAGYITTQYLRTNTVSFPVSIAGSSLALLGYTPAVVLLAHYATWEIEFGFEYEPPLLMSLTVAGILIPLAYIAIGGAIARSAHIINTDDAHEREEEEPPSETSESSG